MDATTSGAVAAAIEPLHSFVYFVPEAHERYVAAGLEPGRMCYFAPRAAPLGPVGPGPVAALFYNFSAAVVAESIPQAWSRADPRTLVEARYDAAGVALRRLLGTSGDVVTDAEVAEAAGWARTAADACPMDGRPMAAALRDLDRPADPLLALWHDVSIVREHRGDGHFTVLAAAGLSGVEAHVTFTATATGYLPDMARQSRGWTDEQWAAAEDRLRGRGVLDGDGGLTDAGWALRAAVEAETDRLGHAPWAALGAEGTARLGELGTRIVRGLLDGGAFPAEGVFAADSPRNPARVR